MSIRHVFWNSEQRRIRAGWRVLAQVAGFFALLLIGQLILNGVILDAAIPDPGSAPVATRQIAASIIQLMAPLFMVVSVWLAGRWLDKRPLAGFGLHLGGRWWGDFGFGLALGAGLMAMIFAVELAAGWVTVTDYFVTREGGLPFMPGILLPLIGYLAVGIGEELWTRGYILTNLAEGFNGRRIGPGLAIGVATIIQGAIFAVLHANNPNATLTSTASIFLIAFLLALGYVLTGQLAISIGLHITWNFFQGNVFGFPVSGGQFAVGTLVGTEQAGPALWTGGRFGPEAGLVSILALAVGSLLTLLWVRMRQGRVGLARQIAEAPESAVPAGEAGSKPIGQSAHISAEA